MKQQKIMKEKTNQWGMTQITNRSVITMRNIFLSVFVAAGLSACGGNLDGVDNSNAPPDTVVAVHTAADNDVQYFVDTLYGVLSTNCSNCHNTSQRPDAPFADDSDPNAAYYSALELMGETDFENLPVLKAINTSQAYSGSEFQIKMIGDPNDQNRNGNHNCGSNCAAWATEMGVQIVAWATLVQNGGLIADENFNQPTNESALSAPPDGQPRDTIVINLAGDYSAHLDLFMTNLYTPYLDEYCSSCHSRQGGSPTTPYFADGDPDYAFRQIVENRKVDLNTPLNSRIFQQLYTFQHNCWSGCGNASTGNAGDILEGINTWSAGVGSQGFNDAAFVNSRALFLNDGQVASGGVRYDRFVIAKYVFDEGTGSTVRDQSGTFPAIDLTLTGEYEWLSSYGVIFRDGSNARSRSITASQKLYDQIIPRGEFSIEAWVVPSNVAQDGPAALVSYSSSPTSRNFTAGQSTTYYDFALRKDSTAAGDNLSTDPDDVVLTSQQHVVMTYSTTEGRRIYVDGQPVLCETEVPTNAQLLTCSRIVPPVNSDMGDLLNWSAGQVLTLASEPNGQRQWQGMIRMVAIHNRELALDQITQNFEAGVGQKFNLLFAIGNRLDANGNPVLNADGDPIGVPGVPDNSYIWFEVSQFDNFSYSFSTPYFIILDNNMTVATIPPGLSVRVRGMRIGLNGTEPEVGQGYTKLDYTVNETNYERDPSDASQPSSNPPKWLMSRIGTIIAKENGVSDDQFFLTFEELGTATDVGRIPGEAAPLPFQYVAPSAQFTSLNTVVGLRTFNEISASMAALTKTDLTAFNGTDRGTITDLLTQLPAKTIMEGFVSSQQMAVANMAGVYCKNLVDNTGLQSGVTRANYFGLANDSMFTSTVASAFSTTNQDTIIAALAKNIAGQENGSEIANQPSWDTITTELNSLANELRTSCDATLDVGGGVLQDCTGQVRTRAIIKAMCMATLGSAAVSHQ